MKISRVKIDNFRCLEHVEVDFDKITTFIGPNGAGKSSILRALNWFFNGADAFIIDEEDVYGGAKQKRIRVEVTFDNLTDPDRERLGKYAPEGVDETTIWRTWEEGQDKVSGKAKAYLPFEDVRKQANATDKKQKYDEIRTSNPGLGLPTVRSQQDVMSAMDSWERDHPEDLKDAEVSDTNFFGFVGQGRMTGLFDFIFVSADMRANEETSDNKSAILGKILERTIDRSTADEALNALAQSIKNSHDKIYSENFGEQLEELSKRLTNEVAAFTSNRLVKVAPKETQIRAQKAEFRVRINDQIQEIDTSVDRQGHGFQRALLIAALKMLSEKSRDDDGNGVICLVIEEPELFQHPVQARAFASTLRLLAEDESKRVQVAYATHSPLFIESRNFHQVRRLQNNNGNVSVKWTNVQEIIEELDGFLTEDKIRKQIEGVCLNRLPEAFFAEKVLIVEGSTDAAVFEGVSHRSNQKRFDLDGIVVADAGGKSELILPSKILDILCIPNHVVFDGDWQYEAQALADGKDPSKIAQQVEANKMQNRKLLKYFGESEVDFPETETNARFTVLKECIESVLQEWGGWHQKRDELIGLGAGYERKNETTYLDTSALTESDPPAQIMSVVDAIRNSS